MSSAGSIKALLCIDYLTAEYRILLLIARAEEKKGIGMLRR